MISSWSLLRWFRKGGRLFSKACSRIWDLEQTSRVGFEIWDRPGSDQKAQPTQLSSSVCVPEGSGRDREVKVVSQVAKDRNQGGGSGQDQRPSSRGPIGSWGWSYQVDSLQIWCVPYHETEHQSMGEVRRVGQWGRGQHLSPDRCSGRQVLSVHGQIELWTFSDPGVLLRDGLGMQKARHGIPSSDVPWGQGHYRQGLHWKGQGAQGGHTSQVRSGICSGKVRRWMFRQRSDCSWNFLLVGSHPDLCIPSLGRWSPCSSSLPRAQWWRALGDGVADQGRSKKERNQVRCPEVFALRSFLAGDRLA